MKLMILLTVLLISSTSMANDVVCVGQTTKASIELGLTGKPFPQLDRADYLYKSRLIPTNGYEFGLSQDKESGIQKLTYKFKTLKKHPLAKKRSNLIFTITQKNQADDVVVFVLSADHEAELKIETDTGLVSIDKMDCK